MRQLYDTTKILAKNYRKPERSVKNKEGKVITDIKKQRDRWAEHFEGLLNRPAPQNPPNIEVAPTDLQIDVGLPDWKEGHVITCDNYRGITLLSIPGKVFSRVLLNTMKDFIDAQRRDQQAGFRKDRSCTDQIVTIRIIVEQPIEWNSSL
ncbi:unnamed protein product [Schistosoma mattheei]|uniref:Uncharacterized protein n=1 Tax=Schistosoma mattheei TaxID=31246 RepID=A0A183PZG2_9TREM|nr:unnamed protein product [Schistosoma mattheei]